MSTRKKSSAPIFPFKVYKLSEAADVLQVDRSVIYKAIENQELPKKKIGKGYKLLGEDLLRYMGSTTFSEKDIK